MVSRLLVIAVLTASPLAAQSPRIADSLYTLAVNPGAHPDMSYVWLLDEGIYSIEADGLGIIKDAGDDYLVMVHQPVGAVTVTMQPQGPSVGFDAYVASSAFSLLGNDPLVRLEP